MWKWMSRGSGRTDASTQTEIEQEQLPEEKASEGLPTTSVERAEGATAGAPSASSGDPMYTPPDDPRLLEEEVPPGDDGQARLFATSYGKKWHRGRHCQGLSYAASLVTPTTKRKAASAGYFRCCFFG